MTTNGVCKYTAANSGLASNSSNCCKSNKLRSVNDGSNNIDYETFFSDKSQKMVHSYLRRMGEKSVTAEGNPYKFAAGIPNPYSFPYANIKVTLKDGKTFELKDKSLESSLTYLNVKGYDPLLDLLKNFQDKIHGNQDWLRKDMCLCSGSHGGLFIVLDAFVNVGDPILVNVPAYAGFLSVLKPYATQCLEIGSDAEGIDTTQLETVLSERKVKNLPMPKILYVNPTGANPTGTVISTERKKKVYEIACKYNFLILEDDPYYLIHFQKKLPTSFLSLDTEDRVIRLDSFSKTLGAGFRVGYVTGPAKIIEKLDILKGSTGMVAALPQVVLYETLAAMGYEHFMEHMRLVKNFYYKNCECILAALEEHMEGLAEWDVPEGGMFIWLKIKQTEHIPENFILECLKKNVFIVPGAAFYFNTKQSPHIRLAYSLLTEEEIKKGIKLLAEVLKAEMSKNTKH